ncbi:hypothetical protein MYIN104542_30345 [Mycobacterium intermedium]
MFPLPTFDWPRSAKPTLNNEPVAVLRRKPARLLPMLPTPETTAGVVNRSVAELVLNRPETVLPRFETPDIRSPKTL